MIITKDDGEVEEAQEFNSDNWNYKNEPHNTPILSAVKRNHTLPETASDTVSSKYVYLKFILYTILKYMIRVIGAGKATI